MQNQSKWRQPPFVWPQQTAPRINAPNANGVAAAASSNAVLNASGSPASTDPAPFPALAASTWSKIHQRVPSPQNTQQGTGGIELSHGLPNIPSTESNASILASAVTSAPSLAGSRPNSGTAATPGPNSKPVLKMKRTGHSLPLSPGLYSRPKSHSPSLSSGPVPAGHANKKVPGPLASQTNSNALAGRKSGSQPVERATGPDIWKPVVGDLQKKKKGQAPAVNKKIFLKVSHLPGPEAIHASSVSGDESDDGEIKYERGQPMGFDDVDLPEDGPSDREPSDGESGSGSDAETIEYSETQQASFRQLFQPPDLESGSDDDDDDDEEDEDDSEDEEETSTSESSSSDSETEPNPAVTEPTASAPRQVPYPSTVLKVAGNGRLYTQVLEQGKLIKAGPAIFPDGYRKSEVFKSMNWICPVRSCRLCYKTLAGLSNHARFAHKKTLLNDNLDGTLSIVGSYTQKDQHGRNPPVVISRRPLDLNESPMLQPSTVKNKKGKSGNKAPPQGVTDRIRAFPKREKSRPSHVPAPNETRLRPPKTVHLEASTSKPKRIAGLKLIPPSQIKPLEMATDDRLYKMMYNEKRELKPSCGALIPRNYGTDDTIPGHPWICPVRTCRCVFSRIVALGAHFVRQHRGRLLNDNLDGTLSETEYYYDQPLSGVNACPGVIISQKPLDPSEGPCAEPKLPAQHREDKAKSSAAMPDYPGHANKNWDAILPCLPATYTSMPSTDSEMMQILSLLRKRPFMWRENWVKRRLDHDRAQVLALIMHLVGDNRKTLTDGPERPCTNCMNSLGPFRGCFTLPSRVSHVAQHCCANCVFEHRENACSLKVASPLDEVFPGRGLGKTATAQEDMMAVQKKRQHSSPEVEHDGGSALRRSGRLHSLDESTTAEPRRKIVKLSLNPGLNKISVGHEESSTGASSSKAVGDSVTRHSPSAGTSALVRTGQSGPHDLELENWEIAPGHIDQAGVDKPNTIAFSNPFIAGHQNVQLSHDFSSRVETVKPGHTCEIEVDANNTRYCFVASGKFLVTIEEGQQQFTIGTHGVFKIMPGLKARVQNRLYFDSALFIGTVMLW